VQAIAALDAQMRDAAKNFDFERAAAIRDRIRLLKQRDLGVISSTELSTSLPPQPAAPQPAESPAPEAQPKARARHK
jgi:UvrB/uvrC motif